MTPRQRKVFEELLGAERERLVAAEAALIADHEDIIQAATDSNLDDEHDPEGATIGFERAHVASLLRDARARLIEVAEAGERLAGGTYGMCRRCAQPIKSERLRAHPTAVMCVGCAGLQLGRRFIAGEGR